MFSAWNNILQIGVGEGLRALPLKIDCLPIPWFGVRGQEAIK